MSSTTLTAVQLPGDAQRTRDLIQSITSDFFNVADLDGRPVASLVVLLDRAKVPVRAELHLIGNTTDETGRQAVRHAQHILEERYSGQEALPLQVWQSFLRSDPIQIPLAPPANKSRSTSPAAAVATATASVDAVAPLPDESTARAIPWKPLLIGVAAITLIALIWGVIDWARSDSQSADLTLPDTGGITAPNTTAPLAPETGDPPADPMSADGAAPAPASDALPPSINAPELFPGYRVAMVGAFRQPIRTEAGANAGEEMGIMQPGQEGNIVEGPVQLPGAADTIVWWKVAFDDPQIEGWVAANNSTGPLLEAVE
jgi:hypothetical protein